MHPDFRHICSPLSDHRVHWHRALSNHPDQAFAHYVLRGIENGFRIGFDHASPLVASKRNMHSALLHPMAITNYLDREVNEGRMFGPLPLDRTRGLHINCMGAVPKGHTPGRWRLITDLSYPEGGSVNEGIQPQLCSLHYTSVESVAAVARQLGKGALLAKLDIKSAYRLVLVHPHDRYLLGVEWKGACYVDGMLHFGLRSAPKIFTVVADALEWIIRQNGVTLIDHYRDDFITMGPPDSETCGQNLDRILAVYRELGVPLAIDKLEGPSHCLTFLGIEMDTQRGVLRLPTDKLSRMKVLLAQWFTWKTCRRRQLESLVGTLQHACRVAKPGRAFLRRIIDLLRTPSATKAHHHIRLNGQFCADLQWWCTFAEHWNGVAMFPYPAQPAFSVTSDASGSWGCGAWSRACWFQFDTTSHTRSFLQDSWPVRHEASSGGAPTSSGAVTIRQRCTRLRVDPAATTP